MKKRVLFILIVLLPFIACTNNENSNKQEKKTVRLSKGPRKPPSNYPDTLIINFAAAVFYHPDSIQLMHLKMITDSMIFDGSMHEFFYQMRNARRVIKKTWPGLKIIEAKNYRYLKFIKKDNTSELIDLNTRDDAYGLFVFYTLKTPLLVDMMNIETEVSFYLK